MNERNRSASQGFIAFILWGVGAVVGTLLAGKVLAAHRLPQAIDTIEHDWSGIWLQHALGALAVLIVFVILFREPGRAEEVRPADVPVPDFRGST